VFVGVIVGVIVKVGVIVGVIVGVTEVVGVGDAIILQSTVSNLSHPSELTILIPTDEESENCGGTMTDKEAGTSLLTIATSTQKLPYMSHI
jgi:hypothetical protein